MPFHSSEPFKFGAKFSNFSKVRPFACRDDKDFDKFLLKLEWDYTRMNLPSLVENDNSKRSWCPSFTANFADLRCCLSTMKFHEEPAPLTTPPLYKSGASFYQVLPYSVKIKKAGHPSYSMNKAERQRQYFCRNNYSHILAPGRKMSCSSFTAIITQIKIRNFWFVDMEKTICLTNVNFSDRIL